MKTIVFDFDGVIHSYVSGWQGVDVIPDKPIEGIVDTINQLRSDGYKVVVHSTRCKETKGLVAIQSWLSKYNIVVDDVSATKPPAFVYVDDRAICFDGNCNTLVSKIKNFKTWQQK